MRCAAVVSDDDAGKKRAEVRCCCVLRYSDSLTSAEMQVWREGKTARCAASLGRARTARTTID